MVYLYYLSQWGSGSTNQDSDKNFSYALAFPSSCYSCVAVGSTTEGTNIQVRSIANTSYVTIRGGYVNTVWYIALGQ